MRHTSSHFVTAQAPMRECIAYTAQYRNAKRRRRQFLQRVDLWKIKFG